jgi:membrane-associated phospholipid phosphatase
MKAMKMIMRKCITLSILLLPMTNLSAQDRQFPYELNNWDLFLLPAGIGLSSLSNNLVEKVDPITLEEIDSLDRNDVFGFDRCATNYWSLEWSERSDKYRDYLIYPTLLSFVPSLLQGEFNNSVTMATMVVESYFLLRGATYLTKVAVQRKRPFLYNTDLSTEERFRNDEDDVFSFYSGHTAVAFFTATFLSKVATDIYGEYTVTRFLWGSTLAVAALTGYARIRAGEHYPTDVVAGAAVGCAVGYFVPVLHRKETKHQFNLNVSNSMIGLTYHF